MEEVVARRSVESRRRTAVLFLSPETSRLTKAMAARGPQDPEVQSRLRRIMLVVRVDVALMFLIVLDMVAKPFN